MLSSGEDGMPYEADESRRPLRPQLGGPVWGIVLAAGSGSRFGGAKQFASAAWHRLVDLAVTAIAAVCDHVVLVLPVGVDWDGVTVDRVVAGGTDRPAEAVRRTVEAPRGSLGQEC